MLEIDFKKFRNNLKTLRTARDMTAKQLSLEAKLRQHKRISDLEEGKGKPSLDEVHVLAIILGVTIDQLLYQELKITVQ